MSLYTVKSRRPVVEHDAHLGQLLRGNANELVRLSAPAAEAEIVRLAAEMLRRRGESEHFIERQLALAGLAFVHPAEPGP